MTLRWGILSTGRIAAAFARAVAASSTGTVIAFASRARQSADTFGDEHKIPRRYDSYPALLDDPDVDAVYIAPPHPMHHEWAIKSAQAGKHILCEKPLTMNHREAVEAIDAARKHNVFLMEAFMYRCHPQTEAVISQIRGGLIGEVKSIQASFGFKAPFDLQGRVFNRELGGGGILDVGCYCVSMARLLAGAAAGAGKSIDPEEVVAEGHIGPESGVDESAAAVLRFPGGVLAEIACGVCAPLENAARVFGTEGSIHIPVPWGPGLDGSPSSIFVKLHKEKSPREIVITPRAGLFTLEADAVATHLASRQAPWPAMTWEDTLGNMKTLDRWREAIGLTFDADR